MSANGSTAKAPVRQYGPTPPISLASPTPAELEQAEVLLQTLKDLGLFESPEESRKREIVLGRLDQLVKKFVYETSLKHNLPVSIAKETGGKIFTFGSYRLGVHTAGADIDTLCVVPSHVTREDFFTVMVEILNNEPDVKEVTGVEEAYVPLITLTFDGIEIDLLFGKVELPSVPESLDLCNDNLLKNLDDKNIRSLNGSRVTDEILRLVPDVQAFRITLRCIKLWAKRRAVYANIVGYLGGVAWAMLVARICQLFPNATSSSLVHKFFKVFSKWKWPEPVLLKPLEDGNLNLKVWNPKQNPSDKAHRMPIITPAYPSMCSTHNVSESTLTIMTEELARGFTIVENIMNGDGKWLTLFEKSDFFFKYKYYLTVNIFSTSQAIHLKWHGMVESRLRHLVGKLEVIDSIKLVHPYIKGFEEEHECVSEEHSIALQKGLPFDKSKNTPPNSDGNSEPIKLWSTVFYMGILLETEKLNKGPGESKDGPKKMDISIPTNNFMSIVQTMDGYDVKNMKINIRMLKSSQLPDSLFSEDELKDRKRKSKSSGGKSKKSKVEAVTPSN